MKILVTSGATREPLDDVRFLSNVSTGATGAALADALAARGHAVTLLHGVGAIMPRKARELHAFSSAKNLQAQLARLLAAGGFDAVIHCAAVADYAPARASRGKIPSGQRGLTLRLVPTPKILPQIKSFASRPPLVIGFKLTVGADAPARATAVARLFATGTVDAVVQNDARDLRAGRARPFRAHVAGRARPRALAGVPALAAWLDKFVSRAPRKA
jgi:phosphopantothenoylcysteine decarboxylase/phosphopantothenate--cysteine ligase